MTRFYVALLVSVGYTSTLFANSSENERAELCASALSNKTDTDLKRLKISTEIVERVEGQNGRLLRAVVHIVSRLDDRLLTRISQSLIEDPDLPDKEITLSNPFFQDYPHRYRDFAAVSLVTLRDQFIDIFDEYELGLLASVIPDVPRVDERTPLQFTDSGKKEARIASAFRNFPGFKALIQIFTPLIEDLTFLLECENHANAIASKDVSRHFEYSNVVKILKRYERGSPSHMDGLVLMTMGNVFVNQILTWAQQFEEIKYRNVIKMGKLPMAVVYREYLHRYVERYLT